MSTRPIKFSIGEYYHIYSRGTDKRDIFLDDKDRERFVKLLFLANGSTPFIFREIPIGVPYVKFNRGNPLASLGAYCLMPNHFHILIKETGEKGISTFMGKLLTSYSSYFNKKYERTGKLFEGAFKATHVDNDEYLKYLFSYIHLNPVKIMDPQWKINGIKNRELAKKYLEEYKYSSYSDYLGTGRTENAILNTQDFPEYFADFKEFNQFIDEWLSFSKKEDTFAQHIGVPYV